MSENKNKSLPNGENGRSCLGMSAAIFAIILSLFWILNLSCGIVEIPDNIPIIGNLDEAFFTMLLLAALSYLGIDLPFISRKK